MKNINVDQLLSESMAELGMDPEVAFRPVTIVSLVEYLHKNSTLRDIELEEACLSLVNQNFDYVVIEEQGYGSRVKSFIANKIRNAANRTANRAITNRPNVQPDVRNNPLVNPVKATQDVFRTKGSSIRNSPMLAITKDNVTSYSVFPDLDTTRPGHQKIIDAIKAKEAAEGKQVVQVPVNDPARTQAGNRGTKLTQITFNRGGADNKKQALLKTLDQLKNLISTTTNKTKSFAFVSQDEIAAVQQELNKEFGDAATELQQQSKVDDTAAKAADAVKQIDAEAAKQPTAPTAPGATEQAVAAAAAAKGGNAGGTLGEPTQAGTQQPAGTNQVTTVAPEDQVIDAEIVTPEEQAAEQAGQPQAAVGQTAKGGTIGQTSTTEPPKVEAPSKPAPPVQLGMARGGAAKRVKVEPGPQQAPINPEPTQTSTAPYTGKGKSKVGQTVSRPVKG